MTALENKSTELKKILKEKYPDEMVSVIAAKISDKDCGYFAVSCWNSGEMYFVYEKENKYMNLNVKDIKSMTFYDSFEEMVGSLSIQRLY